MRISNRSWSIDGRELCLTERGTITWINAYRERRRRGFWVRLRRRLREMR